MNARSPLFALLLLLAACASRPTPTLPPIGATLDAPSFPTITPLPTDAVPVIGATPTSVQIDQPLGSNLCNPNLLFLADVTVPDGTQFRPGEAIDKRWSVRNTGDCAWGPEFRVVLVGGDAMGSAGEVALYPAVPGADGLVRVKMIAPQTPGDYAGTWRARDPQGNQFGNQIWVRITVVAP